MSCTEVISKNIINIGTKTFRHRMEIEGNLFNSKRLSGLNGDLSTLYQLLYSQYDSITETDYKKFGAILEILLQSLKKLQSILQTIPVSLIAIKEINKLENNYSALYELNSDIKNFKTDSQDLQDLRLLLKETANLLHSSLS